MQFSFQCFNIFLFLFYKIPGFRTSFYLNYQKKIVKMVYKIFIFQKKNYLLFPSDQFIGWLNSDDFFSFNFFCKCFYFNFYGFNLEIIYVLINVNHKLYSVPNNRSANLIVFWKFFFLNIFVTYKNVKSPSKNHFSHNKWKKKILPKYTIIPCKWLFGTLE